MPRSVPAWLLSVAALSIAAFGSGGCAQEQLDAIVVKLRLAPADVDFGSIPVGAAVHSTVVVANDGNGAYNDIDAPPELQGDAFLEATACPLPLGPGSTCDEELVFRPQAEGDFTGTWTVHGPDGDLVARLKGHADPPVILVDPPALDFGELPVGRTKDLTFTVTNAGDGAVDAPLAFTGEGAFAAVDVDNGDAPVTRLHVEAGAAVDVTVRFTPPRGAAFTGSVVVSICGDACGPEVALTGTGTAPRLAVDPETVDFGDVGAGSAADVDITASNTGIGNLVISQLDLLTGEGADLTLPDIDPTTDLPIVIAAGASATLKVRWAPSQPLFALASTLRIRSNDPVQPDVLIPIDGSSQGPALRVLPAQGQFGALDPGDERVLNVVVRATGTVPVDITDFEILGGAFAYDITSPPTGTLQPNESLLFGIRATARQLDADNGGATGSFVVHADGLDDVVMPLSFLSGTEGCQPRAPEPNLSLGSIKIGEGSTGFVDVINVGNGACTLLTAERAPGFAFDPGFSFSATQARNIGPGGRGQVDFAYHAGADGQRSAFARLTYQGAASPLLVSATARGVTGTLVGEPPLIEMGPVIEGCAATTRTASFVNAGADSLEVTSITLDDPSGVFSLDLGAIQPPLPRLLVAGASVSVPVSSLNTAPAGAFDGNVVATTEVVEASVRLHLAVETENAQITEGFTAADVSQVDVLFVVDNSGSMADDQAQLAANFQTFIDTAFAGNNDINFHLGITTTDVLTGTGGPLVAPFMTRNSVDLEGTFQQQAVVGVDGQGIELGLEAMRRALDDDVNTGNNAGFLRDRAALSVVIISDEEDNGGDPLVQQIDPNVTRPVESYVEFLGGLKGGNLSNAPVLVSVVVDPTFSQRYQTVANAFGGTVLNIQAPDWGQQLSQIGQATFGLQRLFRLGTNPDPASVTVTVDGVPLAAGDYTVNGRDVLLTNDPTAGASVDIMYTAGCGP